MNVIVTPAGNYGLYLEQTAASVQAQCGVSWRMLLIDVGSKDCTAEIAHSLAQQDTRIQVFSQSNAGIVAARNQGIRERKIPTGGRGNRRARRQAAAIWNTARWQKGGGALSAKRFQARFVLRGRNGLSRRVPHLREMLVMACLLGKQGRRADRIYERHCPCRRQRNAPLSRDAGSF